RDIRITYDSERNYPTLAQSPQRAEPRRGPRHGRTWGTSAQDDTHEISGAKGNYPTLAKDGRTWGTSAQDDTHKISGAKGNYPTLAKDGRTWGTRKPGAPA